MLDTFVFTSFPFASADSTNIARNIGLDGRWTGGHQPATESSLAKELASDEFKAQLPKPPEPPAFPQQSASDGKARFRLKGKPLDILRDHMMLLTGRPESTELYLGEGAAYWF